MPVVYPWRPGRAVASGTTVARSGLDECPYFGAIVRFIYIEDHGRNPN